MLRSDNFDKDRFKGCKSSDSRKGMKMKNIKMIIFFLYCFLLYSLVYSENVNKYPIEYKNVEIFNTNVEKLVVGFWNATYPVPSIKSGFEFSADYKFKYTVPGSDKSKFAGTSGKWKIKDYRLYVQPEINYFWTDFWAPAGGMGLMPGKDNKIKTNKINNSEWIYICDIRSYNYYCFPFEEEYEILPPMLMIRLFVEGNIAYVWTFYKVS
jgi:hypothetical protein